jgi:hypothetical protein
MTTLPYENMVEIDELCLNSRTMIDTVVLNLVDLQEWHEEQDGSTPKGATRNLRILYGIQSILEAVQKQIEHINEKICSSPNGTSPEAEESDNPSTPTKEDSCIPVYLHYGNGNKIYTEDLVAKAATVNCIFKGFHDIASSGTKCELSFPEIAGIHDLTSTIYHALAQNVYREESAKNDYFL